MNSDIIKNIVLKVNGESATKNIQMLRDTIEKATKAKNELLDSHPKDQDWTKEEKKRLSELSREIRSAEKELRIMGTTADRTQQALDNLSGKSVKELQGSLRTLQRTLNSGVVKRGSEDWKQLTEAIRRTKTELEKIKNEQKEVVSNTTGLQNWANKWIGVTTVFQGISSAISGVTSAIGGYVRDAAEMGEHISGVTKYTGMAASEAAALNEEFKKMDTRTPRQQLNDLAADAGRLGIQSRADVLAFVEAADRINVALGEDLGDDAVKNIGKLAQLFGDADRQGLKQAMLSTASVINELAQSSSASEGYLMDFTARLAGVGSTAGMTQAQVMAFGSVLDQGMVAVEKGATAMQNVITALYRKPAEMAKVAGLDVKAFTTLLRTDGNAAVLQFIQALNDAGRMDALAPMLDKMHLSGAGVTQTLSTLAANIDAVRATQQQATAAFSAGTSVTNEFNAANSTRQAELEKTQKKLHDLSVTIGEELTPMVYGTLSAVRTGMQIVSQLIVFLGRNANAIIYLTSLLVIYTTAANAAAIGTRLMTAAHVAWNAVVSTGKALAATYHAAIILLQMAYAAMTGNVARLAEAQKALNAVLLKNPYAAVLTAAVAIAGAIYLWCTRTKELTAEQRTTLALQQDQLEITKRANEATAQQRSRIEMLTAIIHDNARSLSDRRAAVNRLREIIPAYNAQISEEGRITRENTRAVDDYIKKLDEQARAQAAMAKLTDIQGEMLDQQTWLRGWENAVSIRRKRLREAAKDTGRDMTDAELERLARTYGPLRLQTMVQTGKNGVFWQRVYELREALERVDMINGRLDTTNRRAENIKQTVKDTVSILPTATTPSGTSGGSDGSDKSDNKKDDPVRAAREEIERQKLAQELAQRILYEQGRNTRREYDDAMLDIEAQALEKQKALYAESSKERLDIEQKLRENQRKAFQLYDEWSMADIARQEREENDAAQRSYIKGELSEEAYQRKLDEIKLRHLRKRQAYYESTGDAENADRARQAAEAEDMAQMLARRKDYLEKARAMKREYMQKSADERQKDEEQLLDELIRAGVIAKQKKQEYLEQIQDKYDKERKAKKEQEKRDEEEKNKKPDSPLGAPGGIAGDFISIFENIDKLQAKIKDGKATWEDYAAVAVSALSFVSAGMQAMSQLFSAQQREEEAAVTLRYDKEIKKAGENSRRGKKLEEQKQKELAKVKNKYRKKQMAMEIAQAVASTAMAAINSYASASKVSWLLGPIAAAMATAAGMIQIAAIKKQHAAEADGYYAGGFTGGTNYRRSAGTVHEGEFVANHLAVQNPNIMPVLSLIDRAQRNNTVASITAADVSRAVSAPAATAANTAAGSPAVQFIDTANERTAEAIERLNESLEAGIHASVSITGDDGFERQWTRYNRMKQRK